MDQSQKTPRDMVIDRFTTAGIALGDLAIEAMGEEGVRVTGALPTAEERDRAVGVLREMQAQGLSATCRIEVRQQNQNAQKEEPGDPELRFPSDPA